MKRITLTLACLALLLAAGFAAYAVQAAGPPATAPDQAAAPDQTAAPDQAAAPGQELDPSTGVGIQEAADMACSRLRAQANDDYWTTPKNTPITASPLANDPDNEQQNFGGITSGPSNGTAQVVGLDAVKYTPNTNFTGSDSFNYLHVGCLQCFGGSCSEPDTDEGTVFITVTN